MLFLILITALFSGLDNFQVCAALGLLPISSRQRRRLAVAFSASELLAPWLGLALGSLLFTIGFRVVQGAAPLFLLACGLGVVLLSLRKRDVAALVNRPGVMLGLPLSLSLDNLLVGFGLGSIHAPVVFSALCNGMMGAAMSWAGLYVGSRLQSRLAGRFDCLPGIYLCVLSLRMFLAD